MKEGITTVLAVSRLGQGGAQEGATRAASHPGLGGQGGDTLLVSLLHQGVPGRITLQAFLLVGGGQGLTGVHLGETFLQVATP